MKTIKFNAWDSNKKKMYEWHELIIMDMNGHLTLSNLLNGFVKHIKPLQFTGLKDKNEKEIFEGDIIQTQGINNWEVIFIKGCFCYKTGKNQYHIFAEKEVEIIGNIHQDKNLLK